MQLNSIEEMITDERFLAWYFKTDAAMAQAWEQQLAVHPEYVALAGESAAWLKNHFLEEKELPVQQIEAAHQRLQQSLDAAPARSVQHSFRWWWPAAAAVLLVAGIIYIYHVPRAATTLDNTYGRIASYQLPDGSQVILNANSQIKMKGNWEKKGAREVWLKGEAFFKVQQTASKSKFIVHAGDMDVIVTGTQFNIVNRAGERSVLLTEGRVTIRTAGGKEVQLKPGDFIKAENQQIARKPVNKEKKLAWKESKLVLDNTSLQELAQIIENYYGVKVKLADASVAQKRIGAAVLPNDNLNILIQSLEATGEFRVQKVNKEIVISIL